MERKNSVMSLPWYHIWSCLSRGSRLVQGAVVASFRVRVVYSCGLCCRWQALNPVMQQVVFCGIVVIFLEYEIVSQWSIAPCPFCLSAEFFLMELPHSVSWNCFENNATSWYRNGSGGLRRMSLSDKRLKFLL